MIEPNTFEYNLLFTLTIILLIIKASFSLFLGREVIKQTKTKGHFEVDFLFAVFILMLCLFISRIIGLYLDFFLTYLDESRYFQPENFIYYRIGSFILLSGFAFLLFTLDSKVINFKFKGIPSFIVFAGSIFILIYPINSEEDIHLIYIVELISISLVIFIPVLLVYFGIKAREIRKISFLITLGTIIYFISALIVNDYIMDVLRDLIGPGGHLLLHTIYIALKVVGLFFITYGASNLYFYSYFRYEYLYKIKEFE